MARLAVSDCQTILAIKWPSDSPRRQPYTPLELLGIPSKALDNTEVIIRTLAIFDSGMTFMPVWTRRVV